MWRRTRGESGVCSISLVQFLRGTVGKGGAMALRRPSASLGRLRRASKLGRYMLNHFSVDEGVWAGEALGVGPAAHRTWEAIRSTAACRVDGQKAVAAGAHPPP